jgi:antibiotic biosynthesis monooxygenase (ABM) superfamily enzyme
MSFDRYTFVRLAAEHATPESRSGILRELRAGLTVVPGIERLTTGTPADDSAARWDLCLIARFATLETLHAALASPEWTMLVDGWLTERAVVVKSWSFEASD